MKWSTEWLTGTANQQLTSLSSRSGHDDGLVLRQHRPVDEVGVAVGVDERLLPSESRRAVVAAVALEVAPVVVVVCVAESMRCLVDVGDHCHGHVGLDRLLVDVDLAHTCDLVAIAVVEDHAVGQVSAAAEAEVHVAVGIVVVADLDAMRSADTVACGGQHRADRRNGCRVRRPQEAGRERRRDARGHVAADLGDGLGEPALCGCHDAPGASADVTLAPAEHLLHPDLHPVNVDVLADVRALHGGSPWGCGAGNYPHKPFTIEVDLSKKYAPQKPSL